MKNRQSRMQPVGTGGPRAMHLQVNDSALQLPKSTTSKPGPLRQCISRRHVMLGQHGAGAMSSQLTAKWACQIPICLLRQPLTHARQQLIVNAMKTGVLDSACSGSLFAFELRLECEQSFDLGSVTLHLDDTSWIPGCIARRPYSTPCHPPHY